MNKETDVVLSKTRICRKARLEVLLIVFICCVLLACTLLYITFDQSQAVIEKKEPLIERKESFSLQSYVSKTPYPVKIICFASLPKMVLSDYKTMIKDSVQVEKVVVPKEYKRYVEYEDMLGQKDVNGIIHNEFYKDEEHRVEALIMNRTYGKNPYVEDLETYPFKAFRDYRIIVSEDERKPATYYIYGFHRTKPYKYNIHVELESDEEVERFVESFFV